MPSKETLSTSVRLITSYPARLGAYGLIAMALFQLVCLLLQKHGAAWLAEENGPLELTQLFCLLIAVAGIAVAVKWTPFGRGALVATGTVTLYAAARESDQWFEAVFFEDAYKWLVGIPTALVAIMFIYRDRARFVEETLRIAQKPGATLFAIGGICLCFFCQMTDRPLFWSESGLEGSMGTQKSLVEESAELFAYLLIAFSGIEATISALQDRAAVRASSETFKGSAVSPPIQPAMVTPAVRVPVHRTATRLARATVPRPTHKRDHGVLNTTESRDGNRVKSRVA